MNIQNFDMDLPDMTKQKSMNFSVEPLMAPEKKRLNKKSSKTMNIYNLRRESILKRMQSYDSLMWSVK